MLRTTNCHSMRLRGGPAREELEPRQARIRSAQTRESVASSAEFLKVDQVLRPAGSALHLHQVVARAHAHAASAQAGVDSPAREMLERQIAGDARDPLHDVEASEPGLEDEIAAF